MTIPMSRELLALLLEGEGSTAVDSGRLRRIGARPRSVGSASTPDLVLADVQLPGISGTQLARKLRKACGPETLLLAMSGSQPPAKAVSLFDGFLMKPFKMAQVAAAMLAAEESAGNPRPGQPHFPPHKVCIHRGARGQTRIQ